LQPALRQQKGEPLQSDRIFSALPIFDKVFSYLKFRSCREERCKMGYQLELIDVSKLFGDVRAVDNVSLRIQHGEFQDHYVEYDRRF
jgi:hypothetical protein